MRQSPAPRQKHGVPRRAPRRIPISSWRHHRTADVLEGRRLLSAAPTDAVPEGTWLIAGGRGADQIVVGVAPDDPTSFRATVGGKVVATRAAASVSRIDVLAGAGDDQVTISLGARPVAVRVDGGRGRDRIAGGEGAEELSGGPGADVIGGGGGNDRLSGGPGNDDLTGGSGSDHISGGRGRDRVHRQGGVDVASRDRRDDVGADRSAATLTRLTTDPSLRQWLVDAAVHQYGWAFGNPAWGWGWRARLDGTVFTDALAPGSGSGPGGAGGELLAAAGGSVGEGFSRTNVQTAGVDEADLVETDGRFIYTLRPAPYPSQPPPPNNLDIYLPPTPPRTQLVIADASRPDAMSVASRVTVDGTAVGMYLVGDRLVVVTQTYPTPTWVGGAGVAAGAPVRFVGGVTGMAIIDPGDPKVTVTVFDVSDRAAPAVVEETKLDGSYDTSRAVGDRVYVVLRNDTWVPAPRSVDGPDGTAVYESEASYRGRLADAPLADLLPGFTARTGGGAESTGSLVAAPDVYVKEAGAVEIGQNMETVAVLNVGDDAAGPSGATTVAGWAGSTYASADAIYLASPFWDAGDTDAGPGHAVTNLFKFELGPDSVPLAATGEVEGSVLNQFSMDEQGDDFRIATTATEPPDAATEPPPPLLSSSNGVYVLRQDGDTLKVVGSVTRLGITERVQSARFVGDMAYLVTYRRIDPLFAIDLRDPTHPKVAGELKVPGFSSYLQPIGDGLLVGIGRDTDEGGTDHGLQVSLFDVSNPARPTRLAAYSIHDQGSWDSSEAEHNHLAVSYFAEQHVLAIPINHYNYQFMGAAWGGAASAEESQPFRLEFLRVGRDEGIERLGAVVSESAVSRSLRIGPAVFAVGADEIRATGVDTPHTLVGKLSLRAADETAQG